MCITSMHPDRKKVPLHYLMSELSLHNSSKINTKHATVPYLPTSSCHLYVEDTDIWHEGFTLESQETCSK